MMDNDYIDAMSEEEAFRLFKKFYRNFKTKADSNVEKHKDTEEADDQGNDYDYIGHRSQGNGEEKYGCEMPMGVRRHSSKLETEKRSSVGNTINDTKEHE